MAEVVSTRQARMEASDAAATMSMVLTEASLVKATTTGLALVEVLVAEVVTMRPALRDASAALNEAPAQAILAGIIRGETFAKAITALVEADAVGPRLR